jgi:hypothetical protein
MLRCVWAQSTASCMHPLALALKEEVSPGCAFWQDTNVTLATHHGKKKQREKFSYIPFAKPINPCKHHPREKKERVKGSQKLCKFGFSSTAPVEDASRAAGEGAEPDKHGQVCFGCIPWRVTRAEPHAAHHNPAVCALVASRRVGAEQSRACLV